MDEWPFLDSMPRSASGPLVSGTLLKQMDSVHSAVLGGWVSDRRTGLPLLVTVAHLLKPRPELFARPPGAPPPPAVLEPADAYLCTATDPAPVAQVVRMGVAHPRRQGASLDVAVAAPLSAALVPQDGLPARCALPRVGQRVVIAGAPAGLGAGTVVITGWRSGHYGARNDILVAPQQGERFSVPGMSGIWVLEEASGLPVGILVGEVTGEVTGQRPTHGASRAGHGLACLHPIGCVLDLFELALG